MHVLVERSRNEAGLLTGYTENYIRTSVDVPDRFIGRIVPVELTGSDGEYMTSELSDYEEMGATIKRLRVLA